MKTKNEISEKLLRFLLHREVLKQFTDNVEHQACFKPDGKYDDIWTSFDFLITPEGYNFWAQLAADFKFI